MRPAVSARGCGWRSAPVSVQTVEADGIRVFYRAAGNRPQSDVYRNRPRDGCDFGSGPRKPFMTENRHRQSSVENSLLLRF